MRELWLLDFWIYRRSLGEKNQAFERAIRNRPKGYRAGLESGKSLYRKGVSQMLEEFAEKVIKNKLSVLVYWSEKSGADLPSDLSAGGPSHLYDNFVAAVKRVDALFQNKLYFYLAKRNIDYAGIESFLGSYILKLWPQLASVSSLHRRSSEDPAEQASSQRPAQLLRTHSTHRSLKQRPLE